jgi:protein-export membrane protein SecD
MMNKSLKWRLFACAFVAVACAWLLMPTFFKLNNPDKDLPKWLPDTAMTLGLDLQGGVHLVLGVDIDKVLSDQLEVYGRSLEAMLEQRKISGVKTKLTGSKTELDVVVPSASQNDAIAGIIRTDFTALEFVGESGNVMVLRLNPQQAEVIRDNAIRQSIETIRNRIDEYGVAEPIITRKGQEQIIVQFPGAQDPQRLKNLIGQTAQLEFVIVHECKSESCIIQQQQDLQQKILAAEQRGGYTKDTFQTFTEYRDRINSDLKPEIPPDTYIAFERINDTTVIDKVLLSPYLLSNNKLSGEYIEDAFVTTQSDQIGAAQKPVVSFRMSAVGAPLLGELTNKFRSFRMAIVLDGVIKSAPTIQAQISDSGVITLGSMGGFDAAMNEARDLSIVLRAGALPASIEVQEERVIGPSMGRDAIEMGKKALLFTALLVFAFMIMYYSVAGLVASFIVLVNVGLIFATLGSLQATLTLPGIAGIVLTIGMAVDAMILIFERMREEIRAGRRPAQIISQGFENAMSSIWDSNLTTIIGAWVLAQFGTGSIRGFAFTLIVGIFVNVFMASFFARTIFMWIYRKGDKMPSVGIKASEFSEVEAR